MTGDATAVQQAGRAAIDGAAQSAVAARVGGAEGRGRIGAGPGTAQALVLPAAVEQDLRQTLAYDLDRHTPFKPDELWFDAAVIGRDAREARSASTGPPRCARR